MLLVIEMDDINDVEYGEIHKRGCRHVKDPMPMRSATTLALLTEAFNEATGWDYDQHEVYGMISPCAKNFKQG